MGLRPIVLLLLVGCLIPGHVLRGRERESASNKTGQDELVEAKRVEYLLMTRAERELLDVLQQKLKGGEFSTISREEVGFAVYGRGALFLGSLARDAIKRDAQAIKAQKSLGLTEEQQLLFFASLNQIERSQAFLLARRLDETGSVLRDSMVELIRGQTYGPFLRGKLIKRRASDIEIFPDTKRDMERWIATKPDR